MRCTTALFSLLLVAAPEVAAAEEPTGEVGEIYKKPEFPPEYSLGMGFRHVSAQGAGRAWEYSPLESFPTFDAELLALPRWHRVHLHAGLVSTNDWFFDGSYAYRDLVMVRWVSQTSYHNLDATELVDLGTDPRYEIIDDIRSEPLGLTSGTHRLELRLKMPDFPAHLYAHARLTTQIGEREQRFLGGSGSFDRLQRGVGRQPVDWLGATVSMGANAHLGPVEVEAWHREYWRRLGDSGGIVWDFRGSAVRPAGRYRLATLGDGRGRSDTLRVHSSYTGRLVSSLTLSRDTLVNEQSAAASTSLLGTATVKWMPTTPLTMSLRAYVRDLDLDNPETVSAGRVGETTGQESFDVLPSLSTTTVRLAADGRYRATRIVTLRLDYDQLSKHRRHARAWSLPPRTVRNRGGGGLNVRAHRTLKLMARYLREVVDEPSHNTEMDSSDWVTAEASWTPAPQLALKVHYEAELGRRRQMTYLVDGDRVDVRRGSRRRQRVSAFGRLSLSRTLALHAHYAYVGVEDELTLLYEGFSAEETFLVDPLVPWREEIHAGGVGLQVDPFDGLRLEADGRLTASKAGFFPGIDSALAPNSIASYSRLRVRDLTVDARAIVDAGLVADSAAGWKVKLEGAYRDHENLRNLVANPHLDGTVWAVVAHLAREWR